jgi:hypothetical protein
MRRRYWIWLAFLLGIVALWFLADAPQRWTDWRRGKAAPSTLSDSLPGR